jgi:hypothetical protein
VIIVRLFRHVELPIDNLVPISVVRKGAEIG